MKPIELLYLIPFVIAAMAIYMKAQYNVLLYNKRKRTNIGFLRYMQTFEGMKVFYPIFKKPNNETEKELIRKANLWVTLFYLMLILLAIEVTLIGRKSELFQ